LNGVQQNNRNGTKCQVNASVLSCAVETNPVRKQLNLARVSVKTQQCSLPTGIKPAGKNDLELKQVQISSKALDKQLIGTNPAMEGKEK